MYRLVVCLLAAAGIVLGTAMGVCGGVPSSITVQGKLTDDLGVPLGSGAKTFVFRVYNTALAGSKIWPAGAGEVQVINTTTDGLWTADVGAIEPLTDVVFADSVRWLEIEVNGVPLPRVRMVTGPYAFRVGTVDGASGGTIAGKVSIGDGHTNDGNYGFVTGFSNAVTGPRCSVLGGSQNLAEGNASVVAGGEQNSALGGNSGIGGGLDNTTWSNYAGVAAGSGNTVGQTGFDSAAFVGGGYKNAALARFSVVAGGFTDTAWAEWGGVCSGMHNRAGDGLSDTAAVVSGGGDNSADAPFSVVSGGRFNDVDNGYGTVGGGSYNHVFGNLATIGGGYANEAEGLESTVGGGLQNYTGGERATISGGYNNWAEGANAFVGGGYNNHARRQNSVVGGGNSNNAGTVSAGNHSFIGGGYSNQTEGEASVVVGGFDHYVGGDYSAILGGYSDTITTAGDYSYLFGIRSKLTQDSTFMIDMPHIRFGKETGGYEVPSVDGTNGQILMTNGTGKVSWAAAPGIPIPLSLSGSLSGPLLDIDQAGPAAAVDITNTNGATTIAYLGTTNEGVVGFRGMNAGRLGRLDCGAYGAYNFPVERYGMLGGATYGVFGKDSASANWGALGSSSYGVYGTSASQWAGYFNGKLEAFSNANGALSRPLVLTNPGDASGTAVGMLFQVDGGTTRGKGGIAYERKDTWNRGDMHFLQDVGGDGNVADLADAVMTIRNNGNVGVGTKTPDEKLEVKGNIRIDAGAGNGSMLRVFEAGTSKWALNYRPWASGKLTFTNDIGGGVSLLCLDPVNNRVGIYQDNPSYRLDVNGECHATSFPTSSDERLKKNIRPLTDVLGKLGKIRGVSFDWNEVYDSLGRSSGHREIGVIAQEVEAQFPELVTHWGDQEYRAIDYGRMTAVLIEAVKELQAENLALIKRIEELESRSSTSIRDQTPRSSAPGP